MLQRGEPVTYLSFLIMAVVIGTTIFLAVAAGDANIDATVTGAAASSAPAAPSCGGNAGVCTTLGIILFAAIGIAAIELGRA